MHVSAGAGHYDIVHYLHMKGAALDIGDRRGDTPLFWAARHGHTTVVSYLTNEHINVNTVNRVGFHFPFFFFVIHLLRQKFL